MNETFVAIAYRWGDLNNHHYIVYAGQDEQKAIALAKNEPDYRGGKYGCVVYGYKDAGPEQDCRQVAYFQSMTDPKDADGPENNYRIDMFQSLGIRFSQWAEGTAYIPEDDPELKDRDGKPMRVLKPHKVEPPQWVVDENNRAKEICDLMTKLQDERRQARVTVPGQPVANGDEGCG